MHLTTEVHFSKYELNNVITHNRFVQAKKIILTEFLLGEFLLGEVWLELNWLNSSQFLHYFITDLHTYELNGQCYPRESHN